MNGFTYLSPTFPHINKNRSEMHSISTMPSYKIKEVLSIYSLRKVVQIWNFCGNPFGHFTCDVLYTLSLQLTNTRKQCDHIRTRKEKESMRSTSKIKIDDLFVNVEADTFLIDGFLQKRNHLSHSWKERINGESKHKFVFR